MTPKQFLPPPLWRRIWYRVCIAVGYIIGRGYWYWNKRSDTLYWNAKECAIFGLKEPFLIGKYKDFDDCLWEDADREHVAKTVEISRLTHGVFTHQFIVRHQTTYAQQIVDAKGRWLFDDRGEPYALFGWNRILRVAVKETANIIRFERAIERLEEEGISDELRQAYVRSRQ